MEARRDSIASIREGSASPEPTEAALPLLEREAVAAAALVPGRGRVTLVTPLRTAAPPEKGAPAPSLDALTERVVAPTLAEGRLVVLVMGARGKVRPAADEEVATLRRDGMKRPPSAVLTDRVAATVRPAAGSLSLLGPAAPGTVAAVR